MEYTGKIDFFDLYFNFKEKNSFIFGKSFEINDKVISSPFDSSHFLKNELEETIKNYINNNIKRIPFDTHNICNKIGFDYTINESIIDNIKSIDSVNITNMKIITGNQSNKFILQLRLNVYYIDNNNMKHFLAPQLPFANYDISI